MDNREPVFNVPGTVIAVLALLIALHVVREFLPIEDGTWLLLAMAFIPARYAGMAGELPGGDIATVTSVVTHMFVHADATHLAINGAWWLAFGTVLCRRMGSLRFLLFVLAGGMAGAFAFAVMHPGLVAPVIGASGAIAAMMGAVMRFLFSALDSRRGYMLRENPASVPAMKLMTALTDRRVLIATAMFVALNLLAIYGFGTLGTASSIAWEAHLGGYFFGLLAYGWFDSAAHNVLPLPAEFPPDAD